MIKVADIPSFAEKALLIEVSLFPKPGLVDPVSNGAHQDMDVTTFIKSTAALQPFFEQYFTTGYTHQGDLDELFAVLRAQGVLAEQAMFAATAGVNTHKGANFSLAVILGATGYYLQQSKLTAEMELSGQDTAAILQLVAAMTMTSMKNDLSQLAQQRELSYGEQLYLKHGIKGVRGEAASGYPDLQNVLLPYLRSFNVLDDLALLRGLVYLMSTIEDNNILHRGGFSALKKVKSDCQKIHQANLTENELLDELRRYDNQLIQQHLSPGGAADILALGIFFTQLEDQVNFHQG